MKFYGLVLGVLGTWRITHLLSAEDGPSKILVRMRRAIGQGFWGELVDCFYCLSVWVAVPFAAVLGENLKERCLLWLALSGGAIVLERVGSPSGTVPPAIYFQNGEEHDGLLRKEPSGGADREPDR